MRAILGDDICLHGEQICQIEKMKKNCKTLSINENGWQKKNFIWHLDSEKKMQLLILGLGSWKWVQSYSQPM